MSKQVKVIKAQAKMFQMTHELVMSAGRNKKSKPKKENKKVETEFSPDYPLGGLLEPYDIDRDKQLT